MGANVMQQLPPGFQLETPQQPAQPQRAPGIIRGPAPRLNPNEVADNERADRSEARQEAQNTFRTMTAEEARTK